MSRDEVANVRRGNSVETTDPDERKFAISHQLEYLVSADREFCGDVLRREEQWRARHRRYRPGIESHILRVGDHGDTPANHSGQISLGCRPSATATRSAQSLRMR